MDNSNSGLFINRINKDTEDIAGVFMEFAYWISYIISNMGVLVTIFILNKYMFVFSLITTLTCYFIHRKKVNKMYKIQKRLRSLSEDVTSLSTEVIRGIRDIKVLNASDVVLSSMGKRINDVLDERSKLINNRNLFDILVSIVIFVFWLLFLGFVFVFLFFVVFGWVCCFFVCVCCLAGVPRLFVLD